jgi:hypothetical protein
VCSSAQRAGQHTRVSSMNVRLDNLLRGKAHAIDFALKKGYTAKELRKAFEDLQEYDRLCEEEKKDDAMLQIKRAGRAGAEEHARDGEEGPLAPLARTKGLEQGNHVRLFVGEVGRRTKNQLEFSKYLEHVQAQEADGKEAEGSRGEDTMFGEKNKNEDKDKVARSIASKENQVARSKENRNPASLQQEKRITAPLHHHISAFRKFSREEHAAALIMTKQARVFLARSRRRKIREEVARARANVRYWARAGEREGVGGEGRKGRETG